MTGNIHFSHTFKQPALKENKNLSHRKQYQKPQLEELGDLRTLTLGGSPGSDDSGSTFTARPAGAGGFLQPGGFPPLE